MDWYTPRLKKKEENGDYAEMNREDIILGLLGRKPKHLKWKLLAAGYLIENITGRTLTKIKYKIRQAAMEAFLYTYNWKLKLKKGQ